MLRQWQYNTTQNKERRHVMDTNAQPDVPEKAKVYQRLRELEFATLGDVRDLFRVVTEEVGRMTAEGESAMALALEVGLFIADVQQRLQAKGMALKDRVPCAPVRTRYLPPAPTNGLSVKTDKPKSPPRPTSTRGKKADVSQVRLNATGIKFPNLVSPKTDSDWEEIALAVVQDQGRVSLDNLFRLAKSGERSIHRFNTIVAFSDSQFRRFLEPVVYGLASHSRKNKKIRWTSTEEVELEWIGD